jgi:hypothetical protein
MRWVSGLSVRLFLQVLLTNAQKYSKGLLSEILDFVMGASPCPASPPCCPAAQTICQVWAVGRVCPSRPIWRSQSVRQAGSATVGYHIPNCIHTGSPSDNDVGFEDMDVV